MIDLWLFIPACFALNLAFGPNNLLALTHGAQMGVRFAGLAAAGRLLVFIPMIAISALGMGAVMAASASLFTLIKLLGAGYLIWIGWTCLRSASQMTLTTQPTTDIPLIFATRREAFIAASNPKAILIFAAFFPQFVDPNAYPQSYAIMGALFLMLEAVAITIYASIGAIAAKRTAQNLSWFQTASGIGMIIFGLLLLAAKRPV